MHLGKGMVSAVQMVAIAAVATDSDTTALTNATILKAATTGVSITTATASVREIRSPTGGVMQFKGLTQTTANDKYVEVNCRHIEGYWSKTPWMDISNVTDITATSGFMVSCMTGISQCTTNNILAIAIDTTTTQLSAIERTACINDPRYLTWRQMTI